MLDSIDQALQLAAGSGSVTQAVDFHSEVIYLSR
jgi:hypothetical protein